jgi:DNA (cytosine-5)-methyltransferase 1
MSKPRLLDLFCCAGGAGMGYHRAGFEVVGVDIAPQPRYPFEFHQADALEYLVEHGHEFDAIHASPPCQHYSAMQHIHKNAHKWPDLVGQTRDLLTASKKPFVIENVIGAPLRVDLMLCGSIFGLGMIRHRIFESNIPMPLLVPTCHHENMYDLWHKEGVDQRNKIREHLKIDWEMTRQEAREAIPPAYTEYIGNQLMRHMEASCQ